jgi:hypothetical protein
MSQSSTERGNLGSMRYLDLNQHLDVINLKSGHERESVDVRIALDLFPTTARGFELDNKQVLICSSEVNQFCNYVDFLTLDDGQLIALPYIVDKQVKVFATPVAFYVGVENDRGFGVIPYDNWDGYFEQYQIAPEAVKIVRNRLDAHPPVDYY